MMSTRLASSRRVGFSPKALTSVVMFFLASGRDMARMAGLRGLRRNRKISCYSQHTENQVCRSEGAYAEVKGRLRGASDRACNT